MTEQQQRLEVTSSLHSRYQEAERLRVQQEARRVQQRAAYEQRYRSSALFRAWEKMAPKMRLRNRMGRELFKAGFYLSVPIFATFVLTQQQFAEYAILNYIPYIEIGGDKSALYDHSKIIVDGKQSYRTPDQDTYFRTKEINEERKRKYLESLMAKGNVKKEGNDGDNVGEQLQKQDTETSAAATEVQQQQRQYTENDVDYSSRKAAKSLKETMMDTLFKQRVEGFSTDKLMREGNNQQQQRASSDDPAESTAKAGQELLSARSIQEQHDRSVRNRFAGVIQKEKEARQIDPPSP